MSDYLVPVFDIGGVFVRWDPMNLFRKLFDTEDEARWFHDKICTLDWNLEFDAGDIYAEGVARLITRHPKYWRQIKAYDERWRETVTGTIDGTIKLHDELVAADIPTFAITNFSWEKWMSVLGEWTFMENFDGIVVSGLEHLVKPDPRIFRLFCERYSLDPHTCYFVDDNEANVISARAVGMVAHHFISPEGLRADMVRNGLPVKP